MSKSQHQKKFEELVVSMIEKEPFIISKRTLLDNFNNDRELYYDIFCDKIFEYSQLRRGSLLIDECGITRIIFGEIPENHVYFTLLTEEAIPEGEDADDIIVYVDAALKAFNKGLDALVQG